MARLSFNFRKAFTGFGKRMEQRNPVFGLGGVKELRGVGVGFAGQLRGKYEQMARNRAGVLARAREMEQLRGRGYQMSEEEYMQFLRDRYELLEYEGEMKLARRLHKEEETKILKELEKNLAEVLSHTRLSTATKMVLVRELIAQLGPEVAQIEPRVLVKLIERSEAIKVIEDAARNRRRLTRDHVDGFVQEIHAMLEQSGQFG